MRVKGALHIHSTFSHDGTFSIAELAGRYSARGYQFIAIGEPPQDLNAAKVSKHRGKCAESFSFGFLIIPNIEFSSEGGLRIFGSAAKRATEEVDPVAVAREIHAQGGFAVLAHPSRNHWARDPELLAVLDAPEIWNVCYDGGFLPPFRAPCASHQQMQKINPPLKVTAGHGFHRAPGVL